MFPSLFSNLSLNFSLDNLERILGLDLGNSLDFGDKRRFRLREKSKDFGLGLGFEEGRERSISFRFESVA